MKFIISTLLVASAVLALESQDSLNAKIAASVADKLEAGMEVQGVQNCVNKCQKLFGTTAFSGQVQGAFPGGFDTYEFSACRVGCQICLQVINSTAEADPGACFKVCKNTNWFNNIDGAGNPFPILKGVIEADKACEMGCVINTCQYVCIGGTPDFQQTAQNNGSFWPNGGCSIKTGAIRPGGYYSQNSEYSFWNAGGLPTCCSNAYNLCFYQSDPSSQNYQDVLLESQNGCREVLPPSQLTVAGICAYFNGGNCGSFLGE
jgi:hypothetical protein